MFSVLYTHQKAKKAKTWQDGILKVNGKKALLCDEESKTLDSFFVHNDQVTPGEELESDRYLITIEERLHSSSDHTQGVSSKTVQEKQVKDTALYQPGKRKRQCFQPPNMNQNTPAITRCIEPEVKKPRDENIIPQYKRFASANKPPSKNEFFNMYIAHSNKQESKSDYIHQGTQQETPCDDSSSVLQTRNRQATGTTWQQHDQRVPFNAMGQPRAAGKENQFCTRLVPSSSSFKSQKESLNNMGFTESKRSTTQILALFSSCKNTLQRQTMDIGQNVKADQTSVEVNGRSYSHLDGTKDNTSSLLGAQTNSISGTACESQTNLTENDSLEQYLVTSDDLCDSLNLSPDSFAACSSETKAESTCTFFQESHACGVAEGGVVPENDTQESAVSKSPYDRQSNDVWSQNDSESVSPLMRHLTSVDKDLTKAHPQTCADWNKKRARLCDLTTDNSQHEHCNIQSPDSAPLKHAVPVPSSIQQSLHGFQASVKTFSDPDLVQASPSSEQNVFTLSPETNEPSTGINTNEVSLAGYKNIHVLGTQSRSDHYSIETKGFSSHPGSLFTYSALRSQEQANFHERHSAASMLSNRFGNLEPWDTPFDPKDFEDSEDSLLQSGLSPEFYSSDGDKLTQWRIAPVVTTKVIPTDSRTVKAGDGHSWKGSVVSDTVKREGPSVPMVPVQRQQLHTQPIHGDQRAPSSDLTGWIDSISSPEVREDVPCQLSQAGVFATSESIALSATEGFIKNSQLTEQNLTLIPEFVQRVPQLSRRRAPILTAPPEDHDTQHTVSLNTQAHSVPATGMCSTELFPELSHEATAATGIRRNGPFQGEPKGPCDSTKLAVKDKDTEHSVLLGSCRRVGLRRVGLESSRDLPKNQNALSQMRQQLHRKPDGYRPPAAPGFMADSLSGDRSMAGELSFPSAEECDSSVTPTRHVTVPVTFENVMQYRQVFKAALREHLNVVLFELARSYHSALQKVDVSGFVTHQQGKRQSSDGPSCPHGQARLRAVKKEGPNKGRLFYTCQGTGQAQCKFFKWADEYQANKTGTNEAGHKSSYKLTLSSPDSLMSFFKSHHVAFYCECHLIRKHTDTWKGRFGAAKTKKWGRQRTSDAEGSKKGLYLELPRKEHSSTYSKDDIWIISKNLSFNHESTFVASSAYYGPSSSGELEILPISGYSPSNWISGEIVHALMACNAGTELTCISNIEEHVKVQNMPVLPYILHSREQTVEPNIRSTSRASSFVPPMLRTSGGQLDLPLEVTEGLAEEMIARFNLNKDQAAALLSCARMFNSSVDNDFASLSVCLIHGVFGAGKSFLLAVAVLYLVELFKVSDSLNRQSNAPSLLKILVSSTTNVAVDRILLGLLELGFEEFVRVGSIRKIAKPVLPYSVHSTGSDSQELKELQALLKTELTPSERTHVRKSIERHKLGENKKKLSQVQVVGVTCAACVFPCLDKLKFPVLLLDECSQMTEPASLLPMARFECQKLVLVGDPKQLSPTIQGSEPEHEAGLEQTLFDRLMKMGYEPTLLRTQYRCHPAISAISNRLFYHNKLVDGVTADDRSPVVDLVPTLCFYNVARGRERCGSDGSYCNEDEAKFVVFLIERLLESGVEPAQMGVITLYKSQLHTISNTLTTSRATSHAELKAIQISTVDAFQGGEKDVIILSCVRTDHIGFIDCDRRSNVALTRAKRHLLIVGNLKMLSCNAVWGKVIDHCRDCPNGLCNSQDFMKKLQKEESTALKEGPVIKDVSPEERKEHADQMNRVNEQNVLEIKSDSPSSSTCLSAPSSCKGLATEQNAARPSEENAHCLDMMDMSGAMDDDSDVELPTFDIVSSLGI